MEPWQSWTAIGVLGAGMYWYYTSQKTSHRRATKPSVSTDIPQTTRRKADSKPRRKKDPLAKVSDQAASDIPVVTSESGPSSGNEQLKKRKGNKKDAKGIPKSSVADVKAAETPSVVEDDDGGDDEVDNREFARQLASKKTGTNLNEPSKQSQPLRTQKLGKTKANFDDHLSPSSPDPHAQSSTSSTTGADADDDLSSSNSPAFGAQSHSSGQGGVADMLEAPTPGPSVLRLTDPVQPARTNSNKQTKPVQQEETKKQRQNRKRAEQRKIEQQEAEKQRRILLERQLKTAREAEGRPAKNGVTVQKAPESKWTKPPPMTSDMAGDVALLDTFEPQSAKDSVAKSSTADKDWKKNDLPSEEEQMRMLSEMDNDWQTVEKPNKKNRSAVNGKAGEAMVSSSSTGGEEEKTGLVQELTPDKTEEQKAKPSAKVDERGFRNGIYVPFAETGHPDDSDWPVA